MFLYALKGALSRGIPLAMSIEMLSKIQPKPLDKYLKRIIFLVKKKNKRIPDLLAQYDFLTPNEKIILEKSADAKFAIDEIINMRKIQDQFTSSLIKLLAFPALILIVMPFISNFMLNAFKRPFNDMLLILKSKGITYHMQTPKIFYYVYHQNWLFYTSIIAGVIIGGIFILYFYLKQYKPQILYRFLTPVAYDDLPFILSYMSALNKVGFPVEKVAEILAKSSIKPGWKLFFKNLQKRIIKGDKIYVEFKNQGFPKEMVTYIEYDELGGNFWDSIDSLKDLAIERNKEINHFLLNQLKPVFTYLSYGIMIFFVIGIVLLNLEMYNITNLLSVGG